MQSPRLPAIAAAAAFLGATGAAAAADGQFSSDAARWSNGGLSRLAQWERRKSDEQTPFRSYSALSQSARRI